jgi:hypothetical protein
VDPLIDLVRQRTDELQRVADSVRRGRDAAAIPHEASAAVVEPAPASSSAIVAPAAPTATPATRRAA